MYFSNFKMSSHETLHYIEVSLSNIQWLNQLKRVIDVRTTDGECIYFSLFNLEAHLGRHHSFCSLPEHHL